MAAITAGRAGRRVIALDGARKLGAKILVAGGGRCNVTHYAVDERAYSGSSPHAIRNVLGRFGVDRTRAFFAELGVELKQEDTGKLFPVSDDAHTVLDALLRAALDAGVEIRHPWRVRTIAPAEGGFQLTREDEPAIIRAPRVILATGGKALPRSGSDGAGYDIARSLGHTTTPRILPALVPLTLPASHPLRDLAGIAFPATLSLRATSGKPLAEFTNAVLLTHFGLSGPGPMDISRHVLTARLDDPAVELTMNLAPGQSPAQIDSALLAARGLSVLRWLTHAVPRSRTVPGHEAPGMPDRLARLIAAHAGLDPGSLVTSLSREQRRALVEAIAHYPLPVTGDRGFTYAEVTAGGIPLAQVRLDTMESRATPGLHLCGEILDVDGRIGGFNFQWAWASGYTAGAGASRS
ncbi:MAG: aminoacetone oxidase family FAD-binding enzyme [Leptolyngbya sp. PLA1]|nr:aminoacetone oxidase family FAD-binding enzyme [Leptolyngbya sp. PLA1]